MVAEIRKIFPIVSRSPLLGSISSAMATLRTLCLVGAKTSSDTEKLAGNIIDESHNRSINGVLILRLDDTIDVMLVFVDQLIMLLAIFPSRQS